jgi:hypothetical protein
MRKASSGDDFGILATDCGVDHDCTPKKAVSCSVYLSAVGG